MKSIRIVLDFQKNHEMSDSQTKGNIDCLIKDLIAAASSNFKVTLLDGCTEGGMLYYGDNEIANLNVQIWDKGKAEVFDGGEYIGLAQIFYKHEPFVESEEEVVPMQFIYINNIQCELSKMKKREKGGGVYQSVMKAEAKDTEKLLEEKSDLVILEKGKELCNTDFIILNSSGNPVRFAHSKDIIIYNSVAEAGRDSYVHQSIIPVLDAPKWIKEELIEQINRDCQKVSIIDTDDLDEETISKIEPIMIYIGDYEESGDKFAEVINSKGVSIRIFKERLKFL